MIAHALGGVGLFLIGMALVTDGLRAAAGDALRRWLLRFTGGPLRSLVSGAVITALVQSSSATTVATIGFVGAGLLTFEQALGLVFGANIGTTAIGWLVAGLGLKFSMSAIALPLVGVGALAQLIGRGRVAHMGLAVAGFGIIFVGVDVLQASMAAASTWLTPDQLPADTWTGRALLVGLGLLLTAVMQSSGATLAMTLTALHGGGISTQQAAAIVIGANVGTTVTAGLAVIGASTTARRTAFAHLLFNVATGIVAFALLPLFVWGLARLGDAVAPGDQALLLAAFHTAFNVLGVALLFPFHARFAALVARAIRERGPTLTRRLDPRAADQGEVAIEAVRQTVIDITRAVVDGLAPRLLGERPTPDQAALLAAAAVGQRDTEAYVAGMRFPSPLGDPAHLRHVSTVHALDHLRQLIALAEAPPGRADLESPEIAPLADALLTALDALSAWAGDPAHPSPTDALGQLVATLEGSRAARRAELLERTAAGTLSPITAGHQLEALRWLGDVANHAWRTADHLQGERLQAPTPAESTRPEG